MYRKLYVACMISFFAFTSCENDLKDVKTISNIEKGNPEIAYNITLIYSDSGIIKAKLTAPKMKRQELNEQAFTEFPDGLQIEFYDDSKSTPTIPTANYDINFEKKQLTELKQNVVITSPKEEILNTEQLYWDQRTKKIYTDENIKITTPQEIIYGTGMEANQDFSKYTIKKLNGIVRVNQ